MSSSAIYQGMCLFDMAECFQKAMCYVLISVVLSVEEGTSAESDADAIFGEG